MSWFHVAEVEPGLTMVAEPGHVCCWFVHGSERDALIDTGLGICDISAAVATATARPIVAVNTHHHFDHVGGNDRFDDRWIHELGASLLAAGYPRALLERYAHLVEDLYRDWRRLYEADRAGGFYLIGPGEQVRPWPEERSGGAGWRIVPPPPTRLLVDGDVIDLGNRTLRVLHTPGHAPDHICLFDERAGMLFSGDQASYGPQLVNLDGSNLDDWVDSATRLAEELRGAVRVIYSAHCLRTASPPELLDALAAAATEIRGGVAQYRGGSGFYGEPARLADYDYFSVVLPAAPTA